MTTSKKLADNLAKLRERAPTVRANIARIVRFAPLDVELPECQQRSPWERVKAAAHRFVDALRTWKTQARRRMNWYLHACKLTAAGLLLSASVIAPRGVVHPHATDHLQKQGAQALSYASALFLIVSANGVHLPSELPPPIDPPYEGGFDGPAELPRAENINPLLNLVPDIFFESRTARVVHRPNGPAELQTLLSLSPLAGETLQRNDSIALLGGVEYTSPTIRRQVFPALSGEFDFDDPTTWVHVHLDDTESLLPSNGRRVVTGTLEEQTEAAEALLPQLAMFNSYQNSGGSQWQPITVANGASGYCFTGIGGDIRGWVASNAQWMLLGVAAGLSGYFPPQSTFADLTDGMVIDRCVCLFDPRHLNPPPALITQGLVFGGRRSIVIDSFIDAGASRGTLGGEGSGGENQAISGGNWIGPILIRNNALIASGENVMFGGNTASLGELSTDGMNPTDVWVDRNYFPSRPVWNIYDPASDGYGSQNKNNFETKKVIRLCAQYNVYEYWYFPDQNKPINFKRARTEAAAAANDVTFRFNKVLDSPTFLNIGSDANVGEPYATRFSIHDNLIPLRADDIVAGPPTGSIGYMVSVSGLVTSFRNNTMPIILDIATRPYGGFLALFGATGFPLESFELFDNVVPYKGYMVRYEGVGGTTNGFTATQARFSLGMSGSGNLQIGADAYPPNGLQTALGAIAADNDAAFVDWTNGNFRLTPAYQTAGTDGARPGADIDALEAGTAGSVSGVWS